MIDLNEIKKSKTTIPIILDFMEPFPMLFEENRKSLDESFKKMAALIGIFPRPVSIQFEIHKKQRTTHWCLELSSKNTELSKERQEKPNLEIITSEESYQRIAMGESSLFEAYLTGDLRVRGDIELARLIARRISKHK